MTDHSPAAGKMVDLDALEKLAKEARPGPWFARTSRKIRSGVIHVRNADGHYIMEKNHAPRARDDAYFIAAANPATIRAMIAELRAAREVIGEIPKGTGAFFDLKAILKKRKAYDAAIGGEGTK